MAKLTWPKKKEDLVEAVRKAYDLGVGHRNPLAVEWYLNYWYMQGARSFILNYRTGRVDYSFDTNEGRLYFKLEDLLDKYQKELGKFLRVDLRPQVTRRRQSIQSQAESSMAQVTLDEYATSEQIEQVKLSLGEGLLMYGTMGVASWARGPGVKGYNNGFKVEYEEIPPWQLTPIPGRPKRRGDTCGLCRERFVPLKWLKAQQPGWTWPRSDDDQKLEAKSLQPGDSMSSTLDPHEVGGGITAAWASSTRPAGPEAPAMDAGAEQFVHLIECWLHDYCGKLDRYIAIAGRQLLTDMDYSEQDDRDKPMMPIKVCRRNPSDSFWGRSYVGPLVAVNMQNEKMYANLFRNIIELDLNGQTFVPSTWGVTREELQATSRPKFHLYEPDITAPQSKAERIGPANAGEFPGKGAASGLALMDRLSGESPLDSGRAPGRADSATSFGVALEAAGVRTIPYISDVALAMIGVYKNVLQQARIHLRESSTLHLSVIDDALVGVVVDPQSGKIVVGKGGNAIPHPDDVNIDITERMPRSEEAREQKLIAQVSNQLITPEDFWWINYKEKLSFMPGIDQELYVESVISCMWRNLLQYGDGKTGQDVQPSVYDIHPVHMKVLKKFMARATFEMMAPPIQELYVARYKFHEAAMGGFPEGMPHMEDAAAAQDMLQNPWATGGANGVPPELLDQLEQAKNMPQPQQPVQAQPA